MSILITTPTGNIGSRVTARLLEDGADVRVFARSPKKLPEGVRAQATVVQGDLENVDSLATALDGTEAMFFLIPPNMQTTDWRGWMRQIADNAAVALERTGVDRVVFLSSIGAQYDGMGPVSGLGEAEQRLQEAVPNVLSLRAGYFMENFLQFVDSIAHEGTIYHAFPPERAWPIVATSDIGDVAAAELQNPTGSGHRLRGVQGPEDLSHAEAAVKIGEGLGREVQYQPVPVEAVQQQMAEMGLSDNVVRNYGEMIRGLSGLERDQIEPRTEATTTPTTLESFAASVLKPAVDGAERAPVA